MLPKASTQLIKSIIGNMGFAWARDAMCETLSGSMYAAAVSSHITVNGEAWHVRLKLSSPSNWSDSNEP